MVQVVQKKDDGTYDYLKSLGEPASSFCQNWGMDKWNFVERRIPKEVFNKEMINNTTYDLNKRRILIWIGNGVEKPACDFFMDDVRFHPIGAIVTTMYYDETHLLPLMTIDANNNPSNRASYDGFGRMKKLEKITNTTKSVGENGFSKVLQTKEYHLQDDCDVPTYYNGFETTNDILFTTNHTAKSERVSVGYESKKSNRIAFTKHADPSKHTGTAYLRIPDAGSYKGKLGRVTGYYRSGFDAGPVTIFVQYKNGKTGNTIEFNRTELPFNAVGWKPFGLFFDLTDVEDIEYIEFFVFPANDFGGTRHVWFDELKVCRFGRPCDGGPSLELKYPIEGEELEVNSQVKVKWNGECTRNETVKIEWKKGNGSWLVVEDVSHNLALAVAASQGSFDWWPRYSVVNKGNGYKVRVTINGTAISVMSGEFSFVGRDDD